MDDLLEAARNGINGIVADFSDWSGINKGGFSKMKIDSYEKVIEPIENEEFNEQATDQEIEQQSQLKDNLVYTPAEINVEETQRPGRPGEQQAYLNPNELKNIAIKLMPSVDNLMNNIYEPLSRDAMRNISEAAINMAFEFLQVWNEKVSVE